MSGGNGRRRKIPKMETNFPRRNSRHLPGLAWQQEPDTPPPRVYKFLFSTGNSPNVAKENELGKQREPSAKIPRATENPTNCNFAHIVNGLGLGGAQEYTMLSLTYKNMWEYTCSAK